MSTAIAASMHKMSRKFIRSLFECDPLGERLGIEDVQALGWPSGGRVAKGEVVLMRPYAHSREARAYLATCSDSLRPGR